MSTQFKRYLPADASLMSQHVALGRIWDAIEAFSASSASVSTSGRGALGASPTVIAGSGGGSSVVSHNTLPGVQGGDVDNYYHSTLLEYAGTGTGVFVRQVGATLSGLTTINEIQFGNSPTLSPLAAGQTFWDVSDQTLATVVDPVSGTILQHGQEMHIRCVNKTGVQISDGQVVYVDDAQGNRPTCALALANSHTTSRVIGVATQDIANNTEGIVTVFGLVREYDTSGLTDGAMLFLSATTPGLLTETAPASPNLVVIVAQALNSTVNGSIFVRPEPALDADNTFTSASDQVAPSQLATKDYIGHEKTKEPTGFLSPELVVSNYDSTARTVTLTGTVSAAFHGILNPDLISGWVSPAHAATAGSWFLFYDGSNFVWQQTPWGFDQLHIAYVYYGATDKFAIRETHGLMPWQVHQELHQTVGTYFRSGGDMSGFTLSSTTAADRRPAVSATGVNDEDLYTLIPALADDGPYTQTFLTSTGLVDFTPSSLDFVALSGSQPYWNEFTGGNWVQTLMSNNSYMTIWLAAVPAQADATSQLYRYLWLQGQSNGTLISQQNLTISDINKGDLEGVFTEFIPLGKIIIRYTGGNWQLESVEKINVSRVGSSTSPSGYLSAVSVTAPITGDGTSGSPIAMPAATGLIDGYLSATTQTIGGAKTFSNLLTASAGVTIAGRLIQTHTISGAGSDTGVSLATVFQNTGGTVRGILSVATSAPSGASTAAIVGLEGSAEVSSTATILSSGVMVGVNSVVRVNAGTASGTIASVRAGYYFVQNANAAVTITTATGCFIDAPSATGPITNAYGIYVANQRQSGVTASYGISIAPQTGGGYAIMCEGAGRVRIFDTTASTSITTGALAVTGGMGVGGAGYFGGQLNALANASITGTLSQTHTMSGAGTSLGVIFGTTFENTAGTHRALICVSTANPSAASTSAFVALDGRADLAGAAAFIPSGNFTGLSGTVRINTGVATGTVTSAYGGSFGIQNQNANITITTAIGFFVATPTATGPITTNYGLYIANQKAAGVVTSYGLYIDPQTAPNYAILTAGAGLVKISDTTASSSTTTGAVVVTGGVGIGGALFGTSATFSGTVRSIDALVTRSDATNVSLMVSQTSTTQAAGVYVRSGDGTTSARYAFTEYRTLETTPAIWTVGMYATKNFVIKDNVAGDDPLNIVTGTAGLVTIGGSTNRPITFTTGTFTAPGLVRVTNATASTSTTTGALVVTGGAGIGGALFCGALTAATTRTATPLVAGLPAGALGMRSFVTDALAPVWGAAVVGGGAVAVPVYYDVGWKVG